jgi:hypothetical protein
VSVGLAQRSRVRPERNRLIGYRRYTAGKGGISANSALPDPASTPGGPQEPGLSSVHIVPAQKKHPVFRQSAGLRDGKSLGCKAYPTVRRPVVRTIATFSDVPCAAARNSRAALSAVVLLLLSACGGGGGGGSTPPNLPPVGQIPPAPPPPPATPQVSVPTDLPVLFVEVSTDISVYNDIIGELIEGNLQNFVQYVPATDEAAIVATNRSLSYAESISTLKVMNDRAFLVNVSDTGARITELNLDSMLEQPASIPIPAPQAQDSISERCFAVFGNDLVYKVAHRRAPFPATGFEDGPLVRVANMLSLAGPGSPEILVPGMSGAGTSPSPGGFVTDACRGYFDVDGSDWIDTEIGFTNGERDIYRKDPATADPTLIGSLPDIPGLLISEQAYDAGTMYFAGLDTTSQAFAIGFAPLATGIIDSTPTQFVSDLVTGFTATGIQLLDADDGYVGFVLDGTDRDVVMLYDPITGLFEAFDKGGRVNQLQLMFRGS